MTETPHTGTDRPRMGRGSAPKPTLIDLAREALRDAEFDEAAAVPILRDALLEDLGYVDEVCALIIHRVAHDDQEMSQSRQRARAATTVAGDPDSVAALANVVGRTLLDFKLPRGLPVLREATAEQIRQALERYRKTARTMAVRIRWLDAVAARLQPGQRVGEALDELTARKLYEVADAEVE